MSLLITKVQHYYIIISYDNANVRAEDYTDYSLRAAEFSSAGNIHIAFYLYDAVHLKLDTSYLDLLYNKINTIYVPLLFNGRLL